MASDICAYCGQASLTGSERAEHILPAAINGRLTTKTVCDNCNTWAGQNIDQPWLDDLFVRVTRYEHKVPDRRGNIIESDPLLGGQTADGVRIRIGRDGKPTALNSPVKRDDDAGEVHIIAKDEEDLKRLMKREITKAEAAGKAVSFGQAQPTSRRPAVQVTNCIVPGRWERMAAKLMLGLLADTQPEAWRLADSARDLRQRMRDAPRPANQVRLEPTEAFEPFAAKPCTAAVVVTLDGHAIGRVSLMGMWAITLALCDDLLGVDLAYVSDPLRPSKNVLGGIEHVVGTRQGLL
ncbi:MAG: HNH endonuclease [Solirubrobacteraceae bacterium]